MIFSVCWLTLCLPLCLTLSALCLMFRAEHMGPLNSLFHALFTIKLFVPADGRVKRCLGACCEIVGRRAGPWISASGHQCVWCGAVIALCTKMKRLTLRKRGHN